MPSPFPGMNPYLEQPDVWHGFQKSFCPAACERLVSQVRPKHIVRLVRRDNAPPSSDEGRLSFVEIRDRSAQELVTMIAMLSNKGSDADRHPYLKARERILKSSAHFVEIDLLRGGRRPPIDGLPECDYYVMVSRVEMRPRVELWPFRLRDPLPKIPIPLRAPDADAVLDLQAVLNRIYDGAGYEDYIYAGSPVPPLSPDDQRWAAALIAGTGEVEMTPPAN